MFRTLSYTAADRWRDHWC